MDRSLESGLYFHGDFAVCSVRDRAATPKQATPHGPEKQKIQWVVYSALFAGGMAMILYLIPEF
jgi:hypothetical protein